MYEAIMEYWQTSVSAPLNIRIERNFKQITFDECISEISAGKTLGKLNMWSRVPLCGSTSRSILTSRMGEHGVIWENVENMENTENMEKIENIN